MRRLISPLLPVILALGWSLSAPAGLPAGDAVVIGARIVAALVVLDLARRARHAASAWAAVGLLLLTEAIHRVPPPELAVWVPLALTLAALDLACAAVLGRVSLASPRGFAGFAFLGAQAGVLWVVFRGDTEWLTWLSEPQLTAPFPVSIPLSPPVLATFAAMGMLVVLILIRRRGVDAALTAVLVAVALAAWRLQVGTSGQATLMLGGGIVAVAVGVIEDVFSFAYEDALTGLPGRRALEQHLGELGGRYAVAMVDLDRFKRLNDRHGHEAGDQVLRMVASHLATVGGGGTAYRYGGEEFTLLFPGKSIDQARPHVENVRRDIAGRRFAVRAKRSARAREASRRGSGGEVGQLQVTVSIGLAAGEGRQRPEEVVKRADKLLYRAKKAGRNRVVSS